MGLPTFDPNDQPDRATKLRVLQGDRGTGWDCRFNTPPVPTGRWSNDDWIVYIGTNWFRITPKETP